MPKLTDLIASRKTIRMLLGDAELMVTYRPSVITPRLQKAIAQAGRDQDLDAGLLVPMANLLASWDLTDDAGATIGTSPDALADVPAQLLLAILNAIGEDMAPNRTSAEPSRNGSTQTASSALVQTGT